MFSGMPDMASDDDDELFLQHWNLEPDRGHRYATQDYQQTLTFSSQDSGHSATDLLYLSQLHESEPSSQEVSEGLYQDMEVFSEGAFPVGRAVRQGSIVDGLLHEIYDRWHLGRHDSIDSDTLTECSSTSDMFFHCRHDTGGYHSMVERRHGSQLHKSFLQNQSVPQLERMLLDLQRSISMMNTQLVKQLKRRDRRLAKLQRHCDMVTAVLQAASLKRQIDTRMKFSLQPPPSESAFDQWKDAMKAVCRLPMGMPADFRKKVWLSLADHYLFQLKINWEQTLRFAFNDRSNPDDEQLGMQIVKDLHRTGCSNFSGDDNQEDRAVLKRLLLAYARWNKRVGYCQGFNVIAALLLNILDRKEDDAFKVMIFLVDCVLPESYFANNLRALSVDMAVFRDLLRLTYPKLSKHLDKLQLAAQDVRTGACYEPPLTNVFTMQWFLTLFATCLPLDIVLRVWDSVLLEGSEVLLRTALAIWGKLAKRIMGVSSADEFYSLMGELSASVMQGDIFDGDTMVKSIYSCGDFPLPHLTELREKYTYNIRPISQPSSGSKKNGKRSIFRHILNSDEDDMDEDDVTAMACLPAEVSSFDISVLGPGVYGLEAGQTIPQNRPDMERMTLDIQSLKLQYQRLKQRQRQAHIIIAAASAKKASSASPDPSLRRSVAMTALAPNIESPVAMNHLFLGKASSSARNRLITSGPSITAPSCHDKGSGHLTKQLQAVASARAVSKNKRMKRNMSAKSESNVKPDHVELTAEATNSKSSPCYATPQSATAEPVSFQDTCVLTDITTESLNTNRVASSEMSDKTKAPSVCLDSITNTPVTTNSSSTCNIQDTLHSQDRLETTAANSKPISVYEGLQEGNTVRGVKSSEISLLCSDSEHTPPVSQHTTTVNKVELPTALSFAHETESHQSSGSQVVVNSPEQGCLHRLSSGDCSMGLSAGRGDGSHEGTIKIHGQSHEAAAKAISQSQEFRETHVHSQEFIETHGRGQKVIGTVTQSQEARETIGQSPQVTNSHSQSLEVIKTIGQSQEVTNTHSQSLEDISTEAAPAGNDFDASEEIRLQSALENAEGSTLPAFSEITAEDIANLGRFLAAARNNSTSPLSRCSDYEPCLAYSEKPPSVFTGEPQTVDMGKQEVSSSSTYAPKEVLQIELYQRAECNGHNHVDRQDQESEEAQLSQLKGENQLELSAAEASECDISEMTSPSKTSVPTPPWSPYKRSTSLVETVPIPATLGVKSSSPEQILPNSGNIHLRKVRKSSIFKDSESNHRESSESTTASVSSTDSRLRKHSEVVPQKLSDQYKNSRRFSSPAGCQATRESSQNSGFARTSQKTFNPFPVRHFNTNRAKTGLKLGLYSESTLEKLRGLQPRTSSS